MLFRLPHLIQAFAKNVRNHGLAHALARTKAYLQGNPPQAPVATTYQTPIDPELSAPYLIISLPATEANPTISIIVPVYNQWTHTWNCLSTIANACQRHSFEVILADDNSDDETVTEAPKIANLIIVRDGINRRFVRNCNHAALQAKGKFLFFLNNDTKCAPHAIDLLAEMLLARPEIGIIGSKLLYPNGQLQECGGIVWNDGSAANYGNRKAPDSPEFMYPRQVDYVSGAALMIRHETWLKIGGFDDRYAPAYYEDTDLAMATRAMELEVWIEPASIVIHYEGASNGTNTSTGLKAYQVRNQEVFRERWQPVLTISHLPPTTNAWVAAERPHGRSTILVIDHYVPTPDQDAGSACTRHYLETLANLGCRVIFLGENFVRTEPYTTQLERVGIEVWTGNWHANHWRTELANRTGAIDIVIFNRPHITERFLPDIKRLLPHAKTVYFGHDLHFLREERAAAFAHGHVRQEKLAASTRARQQEASIYTQVDAALTISTDEAEQIRHAFAFEPIHVFPGYTFPIRTEPHSIPNSELTLLFVGGFGHAPNQDGVEWFLTEIWPLIREKQPLSRFWIVGSQMPEHFKRLDNGIEALGRLSDAELADRYARCHVVVAPLRYGAGLKGKIVQALTEGALIATTNVGAEGLPLMVKEHLSPCDDPRLFAQKILDYWLFPENGVVAKVNSLRLAELFFSKKSSNLFFKRFIEEVRPSINWLGGLGHDGWIGLSAKIKLKPGIYQITTWCPEFHFKLDQRPYTISISFKESPLLEIVHTESSDVTTKFTASEFGEYTISTCRTISPYTLKINDDQRQLGVKLIDLTEFISAKKSPLHLEKQVTKNEPA